jgi:hypothetical protein
VSKTTVMKLVADAGHAAAWYQDRVFRNLDCKRIQVTRFGVSSVRNRRTSRRQSVLLTAMHGFGLRPTPIRR